MAGRTVILVTHQVALCLRSAAYVVALDHGRVAYAGAPDAAPAELAEVLEREQPSNDSQIAVPAAAATAKSGAATPAVRLHEEKTATVEKRAQGALASMWTR